MDEYIKREALIRSAEAINKEIYDEYGHNKWVNLAYVMMQCAVNQTPNVDAVEVVRCGKCKWFREKSGKCTASVWNEFADYCPAVQEHDFCSYGEKRELEGESNG